VAKAVRCRGRAVRINLCARARCCSGQAISIHLGRRPAARWRRRRRRVASAIPGLAMMFCRFRSAGGAHAYAVASSMFVWRVGSFSTSMDCTATNRVAGSHRSRSFQQRGRSRPGSYEPNPVDSASRRIESHLRLSPCVSRSASHRDLSHERRPQTRQYLRNVRDRPVDAQLFRQNTITPGGLGRILTAWSQSQCSSPCWSQP
jgi:hypothetical protein